MSITPISLDKVSPQVIATTCSPVHVENVLIRQIRVLKIAKTLANEVLTLNAKAGVLGEGKANRMIALAKELDTHLD